MCTRYYNSLLSLIAAELPAVRQHKNGAKASWGLITEPSSHQTSKSRHLSELNCFPVSLTVQGDLTTPTISPEQPRFCMKLLKKGLRAELTNLSGGFSGRNFECFCSLTRSKEGYSTVFTASHKHCAHVCVCLGITTCCSKIP